MRRLKKSLFPIIERANAKPRSRGVHSKDRITQNRSPRRSQKNPIRGIRQRIDPFRSAQLDQLKRANQREERAKKPIRDKGEKRERQTQLRQLQKDRYKKAEEEQRSPKPPTRLSEVKMQKSQYGTRGRNENAKTTYASCRKTDAKKQRKNNAVQNRLLSYRR